MLPEGYQLYDEGVDYLILGADFGEISKCAPEIVFHNDKKYKRGMIEVIPDGLSTTFCSMRRYDYVLLKEEIKMDSSSHFYRYAKGSYQKGDILEDLKKIQGEYCNIHPEHISVGDVLQHLLSLAYKYIDTETKFISFMSDILPRNVWKFINPDGDETSMEIVMIKKCLSILRFVSVLDKDKNVILHLEEPDPEILPIRKKDENESD